MRGELFHVRICVRFRIAVQACEVTQSQDVLEEDAGIGRLILEMNACLSHLQCLGIGVLKRRTRCAHGYLNYSVNGFLRGLNDSWKHRGSRGRAARDWAGRQSAVTK